MPDWHIALTSFMLASNGTFPMVRPYPVNEESGGKRLDLTPKPFITPSFLALLNSSFKIKRLFEANLTKCCQINGQSINYHV